MGLEGNHATARGAPRGAVPKHLHMLHAAKLAKDVAHFDFGDAVWALAEKELTFEFQVVLCSSTSDHPETQNIVSPTPPTPTSVPVQYECNAHLITGLLSAVAAAATACVALHA